MKYILKRKNSIKSVNVCLYLFFIATLVVYIIPFIRNIQNSFAASNLSKDPSQLSNYKELFAENSISAILCNTLTFSIISTIVCVGLASWITFYIIFIENNTVVKRVILYACLIPMLLSSVTINILWRYYFNYKYGIINGALTYIGFSPIRWLTKHVPAMFVLCFVSIWKNVGYYMIMYLAAYRNIKPNTINAAKIDCSSNIRIYLKIGLPSIINYLFMTIVLNLIDLVTDYSTIYLLFGDKAAGVANIHTFASLFYHYMYYAPNRGLASAISVVNVLLIVSLLGLIGGIHFVRISFQKRKLQ